MASTRTVLIATDKEPAEDQRRKYSRELYIAAKLLRNELKIAVLIVQVRRSRPFSGVVVNQLPVPKNNKLIEEVAQRVRVAGTPWAAQRQPQAALAITG